MINIYDFLETCRENGMDAAEAASEYSRALAEDRAAWEEEYYSDPVVMEGARQQDLIDLYRFER